MDTLLVPRGSVAANMDIGLAKTILLPSWELICNSGTTTSYCGTGCQPGFGACGGRTPPISTSTSTSGLAASTSNTLQDCLGIKNVPVSFTNSASFSALAQLYNLRLAYTPAVIVLPTITQHIIDAVLCATESSIKVQAKSGGHSYASFSSGGQIGAMVIDLESFQQITVGAGGVAQIGGGVRLGDMALGIFNQSQRPLTHGTCPGVGIGGHASHGAFSLDSRMWGLTLDTIVGFDVVLANGSFIHATLTAHPDIY